ncbi:DNA-protecting protein DprA [Labedella phragmitis]|uniref:DNA-protecting protein DprA n=1 Tax=Labedella phragmitis TaxID=2498849 RepID=A0A3S3Z541_9MICO|nr:DNA-processing protein DprA [Labedella phragmitis]RWZ51958.1 DNA-protecting protein DprA [Labedella phragmitis]
MRLLGLSEAQMVDRARRVSDAETVPDLVSVFARGAWTTVAEPGDGAAGGVVAALGPAVALRAITERWSAERVRARCESRNIAEVAEAVAAAWSSGATRWRSRLDGANVAAAFDLASRTGVRLVVPGGARWPERVVDLGVHAPVALWMRSRVDEQDAAFGRSIALVGARAATGYGEHVTLDAASGLVDRGFTIISGAAYGIDGMAHRAALAGRGRTIAFLAGGLDRPYPSGHASLIDRIATTGAVYSEVPCGAAPTKWRFLQRNRLIAASSAATVVLEAGRRSGSLNTAGHAASLGRPLGAVPGPVTSAASAGCHRLLREYDATCVTTAAEMAELVEPVSASEAESAGGSASTGDAARSVLAVLNRRSATTVGQIADRTGLTSSEVQSTLGLLDLEGAVVETASGWSRP